MKKPPLRVMIVEDDPAHAEAIRRALKGSGTLWEIQVAGSLKEYHERVASVVPDIVLMDMNLPDGRAVDVLTAPPEDGPFPVLIMTSYGNEKTAVEAMKSGALDYTVKSLEVFADMPRILERALREWKLLKEAKQKDEALKESEEKYRGLVENLYDIVYRVDTEGQVLYISPLVEKVFGYKPDDLIGKPFFTLTYPEDLPGLTGAFKRAVGEDVLLYEFRAISQDGTIRYARTSGRTILMNGKPVGQTGILSDITERKRAEEALKESEEKYRSLVENLNDVIFNLDPQGNITYMNRAAESIFGYRLEEIVGTSFAKYTHPDDLGGLMESRGETLSSVLRPYEFRMIDKKGFIHYVHTSSQPIERDGQNVGMTGILTDITERRRAEEALRNSEEKFRSLFQTSRDFLCITDREGIIVDTNFVTLGFLGYSYEELSGTHIHDLYANPEDRQRLITKILKSGYVTNYEMKLQKKGGEIIDVLMTVNARKDNNDKPVGFFSIAKDITEKRKMELQLLQTEKLSAVGTMISGVAHEFNNPLTAIIGNAELLMKRDLPEDIKNKLNVILKESIRSSKIVGGLLAFAREHKPERNMVYINDIITETMKLKEYDMKVNNTDVKLSLADVLPKTFADPFQLQQVFINFVNNAQDALADHKGGALAIRTYRNDDAIIVEFEDNGPGIADKFIKKIFDPFFTTKETGKGTGLGLSMAYGIVKEHNGTILVESKPGKGVKFVVMLPITESPDLIVEEIKTAEKLSPSGKTALVVDDEKSIRDFVSEALSNKGVFVEAVSNGEEAIKLIETRKFDVVISDIKMPGISGKDLYLYVQKHHPEIAETIIFMTGDVLSKDTQLFLQVTGNRFIEKPFDVDDLVAILNDVLPK